MPETLTGPGGKSIEVDPTDQQFAAAMSGPEPGAAPDRPPPRRRDPDAPHGLDDQGRPKAPYGLKEDGKPRITPAGPGRGKTGSHGGRQQHAEPKPGAGEDSGDALTRRAADATTTLELLSAIGTLYSMFALTRATAAHKLAQAKADKAAIAKAETAYSRAQVIQLDAAACALHADAVGPGVAQAAQANAFAAALVDRLALFNGVASVGVAVLPLVYQVVANHAPAEAKDNFPPELLTLGVLPPNLLLEKLEAQNAVKMARAQADILAEKTAAQAELEQMRAAAA